MDENEKFGNAEEVELIAESLIPNYHPELATARIKYLFVEKAPKKGGRELPGKASKVSGKWEHLTELDFTIEVPAPTWDEASNEQRQALVDHLLEYCTAEEDEKTGDFKWLIREPDVREFSSILQRHSCWNDTLTDFVTVAQGIDVSGIVDEEMNDVLSEEEVDLTVEE